MTHPSERELLVLHALRLLGYADDTAVARRFGLDAAVVANDLLDAIDIVLGDVVQTDPRLTVSPNPRA